MSTGFCRAAGDLTGKELAGGAGAGAGSSSSPVPPEPTLPGPGLPGGVGGGRALWWVPAAELQKGRKEKFGCPPRFHTLHLSLTWEPVAACSLRERSGQRSRGASVPSPRVARAPAAAGREGDQKHARFQESGPDKQLA